MQVVSWTCCGVFIASELLVIMCHIKLCVPASLCIRERRLNVYSSSNLWNIITDQSCAFLPKGYLVRGSAWFGVL